jgi:hypothetical protein
MVHDPAKNCSLYYFSSSDSYGAERLLPSLFNKICVAFECIALASSTAQPENCLEDIVAMLYIFHYRKMLLFLLWAMTAVG